jgi:dTDP-N-acetylfucosamine:lipid II N-acetylfucosaminyltransferase
MIIHFMYDEKIINQVIDNFEEANPGKNLFLVYRPQNAGNDFKYIKRPEARSFNPETDSISEIIAQYPQTAALICHSLTFEFAEQLIKIQGLSLKIFWLMWGFDIYSLPQIKPTLYAPFTKRYIYKVKKGTRIGWFIKQNKYLRSLFFSLSRKRNELTFIEKAHKMIDFCGTYIKEDFDVFKTIYPNSKGQFFYSTLLNLEQYIGAIFLNKEVSANNILIGNSNSEECNHIDVFHFLANKLDNNTTKVYVPLSYGSNEKYKQSVLKEGQSLLSNKFNPLLDFMSLEEYVNILSSCGVGIFYHYRQQAMGNIIAMLWLGARIYLSSKNPAYHYFKRVGIKVYNLESDFNTYKTSYLSNEDRIHNRLILKNIFSKEIVLANHKNLVVEAYK